MTCDCTKPKCDCPVSITTRRAKKRQSVHVELPMRARPQGSKRHVGGGRLLEMAGENLKVYRNALALAARVEMRGAAPFSDPVSVCCTFVFTRPKSHYTAKGLLREDAPASCYPCKRGDIDKLQRSTYDALSGIVYDDDSQIVSNVNAVVWGLEDATNVTVTTSHDAYDAWAAGVAA